MNVIVHRVAEFMKRFPPFSFLSKEVLEKVAASVEIRYLEKGEILFRQGQAAEPHFYILKEGAIILTESIQDQEEIRDQCDEGDVFGVLALLGKRPYLLSAKVEENSLIYAIPVAVFEEVLEQNSRVALYFAAGFASGQVVVRQDLSEGQKARGAFKNQSRDHSLMIFSDQSQIKFSEKVLTCRPEQSIQEAAAMMAEKHVSSIVVSREDLRPLGIITDKDLRSKVVAKGISLDTLSAEVMSSPVLTMRRDASFSDLYLTMIKNRLHHLILTEDGTAQSAVCGIISDHDVLLSMGNSPAVLIHGLMNTLDLKEMRLIRDQAEQMLRYYLENELTMDFVASVMTEVNDIIIKQAMRIAENSLSGEDDVLRKIPFCFLSMGSEGREEQLLRTDQDNALVYENVPEALAEEAQEYFLKLGTAMVEVLLACGFASCPGDIMASNPKWVQPISKWKSYFSEWIIRPTEEAILSSTIFFDFRPVAGYLGLGERLSSHIYEEIQKKKIFLNFLAKNALMNPPPLGFFKDFVVEKSGEQKNNFDIKSRAMMPLADLARLLVLSHGVIGVNNTFKRFDRLAELEPNYAALFKQAAKAYEILMRTRALEGLKNQSSGRFIQPETLGKLERQLLKNTFSPITELQNIVKVRFQLDYFPQ
jgi:CBS domain-containing protein